jgi:hypothetical protein
MTGRRGPACRNGARVPWRTAANEADTEPRSKGGVPSIAANSVAPKENRSDAGPNSPLPSHSGAT